MACVAHEDTFADDKLLSRGPKITEVRDETPCGGWDCIAGRRGLFNPPDLALYDHILEGQSETLAAGAGDKVGMYATNAKGTA